MKKFLLMLLSAALLLLPACAKEENGESIPKDMKRAGNDAVDYYFYYPKDWMADRNDGMISIRYNTSLSNKVEKYASISVTSFTLKDPKQVVNEYWKENEPKIKALYENYEFLHSTEIELDEVPAAKQEYTGELDGNKYNFVQVICIRNGVVYLITYTASEEDYESTISCMETVIANFHFE